MSYRVDLHVAALAQMKGLPEEALDALISRTVDLVDKPWDARVLYKDDPDVRMTTFGDFGVLYFKVDEATELITIFNVTWAG
jgi:mRNA-degrading endonuclease RelE of RelBE toxin-antitoxin system